MVDLDQQDCHLQSHKIKSISEYISKFTDDTGIPFINEAEWKILTDQYTRDEIREGFADYIITNNVQFPYRIIEKQEVDKKFNELKRTHFSEFIMNNSGEVIEKYDDYKYPYSKYGKFVILFGHYHNDISNYYQQKNRYDCASYTFKSPNEIWKDKTLLSKMNWTFNRLETQEVNLDKIRESFRLGSYVATQFKPHVAKTIYDFVLNKSNKTGSVLDISMGWGDRLAGFYASRAKNYMGFDPNPKVYEIYKQQCIEYELLLSGEKPIISLTTKTVKGKTYESFLCIGKSGKVVQAFNAPAEDLLDVIRMNKFDCIFTSPPYFSTELYAQDIKEKENQSWFKYPEYDNWWNKFFKPVITACFESLTETGSMMFNIMDPTVKAVRHKTCDQMVDHVISIGGHFDGQIGMRIKQRPKKLDPSKLSKHLSTTFIENIWCFSKNGFELSHKPATLESLFGD